MRLLREFVREFNVSSMGRTDAARRGGDTAA